MSQEPNEPKRGDFAKKEGEIILREHEFDGIQEYDQKLPNWWLFTFYGAIVWFVIHWALYYHTDLLRSPESKVQMGIEEIQKAKQEQLEKTLANLNDSVLVHQWAEDPSVVGRGEEIYMQLCSPCHANDLSATMQVSGNTVPLPGLPLNDGEWKFGGKPMDLFEIINEGSPPQSKGHNGAKMQAWSQLLSPVEVAEVVAYLIDSVPEDFQDIPEP
ncbi:MAG: cbb3-type cytochrome c oxidase N-terminal domain-containing protein [Akkermansiaceae bacterium]|nr:cbb3-type cytochrome c oxidase N-terminal domain-containing protein [Akkermansiaceae bacterium]